MKEYSHRKKVEECLSIIIEDDVDQVLFAFGDIYVWLTGNVITDEGFQGIPKRFLNQISQSLNQRGVIRRKISEIDVANRRFRAKEVIANNILNLFLKNFAGEEAIDFLGNLIGQYALVVPELLFRTAESFLGMHQTPNIQPIDDNLPMTDEMILYCWQYYWFYSALGC